MKIAIPKERHQDEARVAATPETVKKLIAMGLDVALEAGAGAGAAVPDAAYTEAGATIEAEEGALLGDADIVLKVRRPLGPTKGADETSLIREGAVLIGMLDPYLGPAACEPLTARKLTSFALELVPRITRAQAMDVLSSQANLAGYRAVIEAAAVIGRAMPLMMTAAGRINPAKVFVIGAGVAGLQAIATARRLGAVVTATDVRPAAKEQVASLGAGFIMVESEETKAAETAGGYAREMSEDYKRAQAALVAEHVATQDIVITTALIPGRPAPTLVSADMVKSMRAGSVIVDLAVEQGGNCALSKAGKVVTRSGVTIVGYRNLPSRLATDASALYARNLLAFLTPLIDAETKSLAIDWEDDIVKGACLTREGRIVHPSLAGGTERAKEGSSSEDAGEAEAGEGG